MTMVKNDKKKVPSLRFPGFSADWEEKRLGEVGKFKSGHAFPLKEQGGKTGVPFFKVSDMNLPGNEHKMIVANNYVNISQIDRRKFKVVNDKSIVFAKVGAALFLERKRIAKDFLIDNNMMSFSPYEDVLFVRYLFDTFRISSYAQMGALPSIGSKDLSIVKIRVPSLPEQQKIADFLSAVDKWIETLKKQKEQLERYKKGLMQKIFSQEIRFKSDNGEDFPDWEEKRAEALFMNCSNKDHNGKLPLIAVTQDEGVVYREDLELKIHSSSKGIKNYKIVEENNFVISLRSFQGGIERSMIKGICSPAYTILKPKVALSSTYFKFFFKTNGFINRLQTLIYGIRDGKQISFNTFKSYKIQFPSLPEQQKIADFLSAVDKQIKLKQKQIEKAEVWKKGLLQSLFI